MLFSPERALQAFHTRLWENIFGFRQFQYIAILWTFGLWIEL